MKVSKAFTTVTPFSKILSLLIFISLPFLGFYLGMQFQQSITPAYPPLYFDSTALARPVKVVPPMENLNNAMSPAPTRSTMQKVPPSPGKGVCTQDVKQCPNGKWVGRTGPQCEFVCN